MSFRERRASRRRASDGLHHSIEVMLHRQLAHSRLTASLEARRWPWIRVLVCFCDPALFE